MGTTHRNSSGFTIVELLVVIVVIGILAAITIVSFNGVTAKASRTVDIAMLKSYMDGLQILASTNDLPFANACLGPPSSYPSATGNCLEGGQYATKADSAVLNAKLNAIGVQNQEFKEPLGVTPQFTYHYAGTVYSTVGYNMPANTDCGFRDVLSRLGNNGVQNAGTTWGLWGDKITFKNVNPDQAVFCLIVVPIE